MAYQRNQRNQEVTYLRSRKDKPTKELSGEAGTCLAAFAEIVLSVGDGIYFGQPTTAGTIKIRVYTIDGPQETYLGVGDSPAEVLGEALDMLYGAQYERRLHELVAGRSAERPPEGRQARDLGRGRAKGAPVDPGASQEP